MMMTQNFSVLFFKIQQQLEQHQAVLDEQPLIELVDLLRPKDAKNTQEIKEKITQFIHFLSEKPE